VIGLCGAFTVYAYARSFDAGELSAVMPFDFLRMPVATAAAWLLFSEPGDVWTWAGSAVIFAGAYSLARHESRKTE